MTAQIELFEADQLGTQAAIMLIVVLVLTLLGVIASVVLG